MHADEMLLQRLHDGELAPAHAAEVRVHLGACATCRAQSDAVAAEARMVDDLLAQLDVRADGSIEDARLATPAATPVTAATLITRAHAADGAADRGGEDAADGGPVRWQPALRWAASLLLAVGVASAAWAVPGSPVRAWVRSVQRWAIGAPAPRSVVQRPAADVAGIAVTPGDSLVLAFATTQPRGDVLVSLVDGPDVLVRAPAGAATYGSEADRLSIGNAGGVADFTIGVPRSARHVEILVARERVFLKVGTRIVAPGATLDGAQYRIAVRRTRP